MANPGVGNKFVSVNLSKSYGHSANPNFSYGSGRGRPGVHGGTGAGGMVVLSRPRSAHKVGSKLSVPPPLNLPSRRKEHERFDPLGSGTSSVGGMGSGSGARPSSSGIGWSKPSSTPVNEGDAAGGPGNGIRPLSSDGTVTRVQTPDGAAKGSSTVYVPPSVKLGSSSSPNAMPSVQAVGKPSVLRGEDFPSLKATLTTTSGPSQKQKDSLIQKQRQGISDELPSGLGDGSYFSSRIDMRPQGQSALLSAGNGASESISNHHGTGNFRQPEQTRKQDEHFPGPLPLVRVNPRSDWADDERDTGRGFMERSRDYGPPKSETYWDRDFDLPRSSVLPAKPAQNHFDRHAQRDNDAGKSMSTTWGNSVSRDRDITKERNVASTWGNNMNRDRDLTKESKYAWPQLGINARHDYSGGTTPGTESVYGKRDTGYGQGGRQPWNNVMESSNGRVAERSTRDRYGNGFNRPKVDTFQSSLLSKHPFSATGKTPSLNDPLLNFGREKRAFSRNEKPYVEDPFMKDGENSGFDGRDPFTGGILGVVKRKKDVNKQADFHDPVRESFEAELERVQKMQEQERKRVLEEQERALEMARREEEERLRLAREQEEHQHRLEEEAREAAWKAEREKVEAMQRAEEQRIAREEEKRRMQMEEERRKQAAKQKLLELEEKIAKRQAESANNDTSSTVSEDRTHGLGKERDQSRSEDLVCWEDSERMVESITSSVCSDPSGLNRSFDMGSRNQSLRDGAFAFTDKGRPQNSRRMDVFENGNSSSFLPFDQEYGHHSPRQDAFVRGKVFPGKELYGSSGYLPPRGYYREGIPEPTMTDFAHAKGRRNMSGDADPYGRHSELDSEYHDGMDKFGEMPWSPTRPHGIPHPPYPDHVYQNSDPDEVYSYGRSRYSARQPRVLPPPSLASVHRSSFRRGDNDRAGASTFDNSGLQYSNAPRSEPNPPSYENVQQEKQENSDVLAVQDGSNRNDTPRCDSQSSLSVSSPPTSPSHLSHDDLDECGDSSSAPAEGTVTINEAVISSGHDEKENLNAATGISEGDDDAWTVENNDESQEQEEYDEDEGGYREEEEVHEGDREHEDMVREFEEMQLAGDGSASMMENLVLGFDQGVEVGIPIDECERSSRNGETSYVAPQASAAVLKEQTEIDVRKENGASSRFADGSPNAIADISGGILKNQNSVQGLPTQSSAQTDFLNSMETYPGSTLSTQQPVASSVEFTLSSSSSSSHPIASSVSSPQSQGELPVKLQFGLFSGPSLIPSPLPAIQIGSIQMPLHLHPQVGPSLTHMHSSQPPLFQFGQLRYPSPMSQGLLPMVPPSMSLVQPNIPTSYPLHQRPGGILSACPSQCSTTQNLGTNDLVPRPVNNLQFNPPTWSSAPQAPVTKESSLLTGAQSTQNRVPLFQTGAGVLGAAENPVKPASVSRAKNVVHSRVRSSIPLASRKTSAQVISGPSSSHSTSGTKDSNGYMADGQSQASRGRKIAFTARNAGPREMNGFIRRARRGTQRMEFRVRESVDKKQSLASGSSNDSVPDDKSPYVGKDGGMSHKSGLRKDSGSDRSKQVPHSENLGPRQVIESRMKEFKTSGRDAFTGGAGTSLREEGSLKRNISPEDDVDAPLQSGVVRVFKQPGIEAPSDEDDFIEVRSKRQMLNDRREQREKEIKAKFGSAKKVSRKPRPSPNVSVVTRSTANIPTSVSSEVMKTTEVSVLSQQPCPIGTHSVNADSRVDAKSQATKLPPTSAIPVVSLPLGTAGLSNTFESKHTFHDGIQVTVSAWGDAGICQQVVQLTQSQLDEALKPGIFDKHSSVGDIPNSVSEPTMSSSSILGKDFSFSSATSPINSLLAGEKIQFGAVTSPTVLPPSNRVVPNSIGPPGSSWSDPRKISVVQSDCAHIFEKVQQSQESCLNLEDSEAAAEAAASAVAVAAISNDEVVGNGGPSSSSAPITGPKSYGGDDVDGIAGTGGDQQVASHSKTEETLSVSLPADLSVENPPISLWPPLPSPHGSSSQMLSPFPGGAPSHFPYYDMNPMMRGPVYAFGPHDESTGSQPQPQKSSSSLGPLGPWQHTSMDSFYGPPARFSGPFINQPAGVPGVQGPPHMVVYNHFPIGQFGQVGLSYMGAAYIPSGKQPDWKHNPTSAPMGTGEGEMNLNMASTQCNPPNMSIPVQHLAPGSPLLSMPSPLAMFEVSPFQTSADMSAAQACWSHVPVSPLHSVPQSMPMPLQQHPEPAMPSQLNPGPAEVQVSNTCRLPKSRMTTALADSGHNLTVSACATANQFKEDLGLVDTLSSSGPQDSNKNTGNKNKMPGGPVRGGREHGSAQDGVDSRSNQQQVGSSSGLKGQASSHQKHPSNNYGFQRGGTNQKNSSGSEWAGIRKMGFHGRNNPTSGERGYPPTKMKQIYVAKQSTSGAGT